MSKTCKKLLASALAAAMLITTFVSSFVVSAATTGTLTIEDTTITVGAEEAVVNFKLAFDAYVEAPHELATITVNPALTIKDIALGDVAYETAPVDPEDPELESPALTIKTDGINKEAGKVLFESGVDGAVKANEINFTVTFDTSAADVGEYVVSAAIASTDINEADIAINCDDTAKIIVEEQKPVEPECEHDWVVVEATPATGDSNNNETSKGSISFKCTKCEEEDVKTVNWDRYSRPMYTGLLLESELIYTQSVRDVQDLSRVGTDNGWTDLYLQFVETKVSGSFSSFVNIDKALDTTDSGKEVYKFSYGVASTGLVNSITTYAYTYNATDDQWYSGETTTESVVSYAKQLLPTATDIQRTLIVDVLHYGAAAQLAFNYAKDNLADADLVGTDGVDYSSYGTSGQVEATNNSTAASSSTAQYPLTVPAFGAECESRLILNVEFQFGKSYYGSYVDQYDGMYVEISYKNVFGEDRTVTYYNSTVSDGDFTFTQIEGNDRRFKLAFNDFTAGDMRNRITFKVYTADGTLLNSDSTYCIEDYVAINRAESSTSAEILNLVNEMLQFGDSANALITSK